MLNWWDEQYAPQPQDPDASKTTMLSGEQIHILHNKPFQLSIKVCHHIMSALAAMLR